MCGCCRGGACPGSPSAKGTVLTGRGGSLATRDERVIENPYEVMGCMRMSANQSGSLATRDERDIHRKPF
eukprot:1137828-Pelagomonas_calceolata.AAC.3